MAIPPRTIRTMQDIRTHSGRASENFVPYKAYMRLSCLEMEKFRRSQEREKSLNRIKNIEQRFKDIEAEKLSIMAQISEQTGESQSPAAAPASTQKTVVNNDPVGSRFRFRY